VVVLLLALMLVMSSMDTLLNGIASTITSDLARYRPDLAGVSLLRSSRVITAVLIVPAIFVASQGWSVLYLFLIADLVCAAVLFPVFFGMYTRSFSASDALVSSVAGLVVGALLFPLPDFSAWNSLPLSGSTLYSFGAALGVSTVLSIALNLVSAGRKVQEYDFARLAQQVKLIAD
jgi:Na+/proline symporter